MADATALVTDDATPPFTCSCDKLVAAGWRVNCAACGRAEFSAGEWADTDVEGLALTDGWSSIEPDDVERDDRLVDEAERRVA